MVRGWPLGSASPFGPPQTWAEQVGQGAWTQLPLLCVWHWERLWYSEGLDVPI